MMSRLRLIDGVTHVTLAESTKNDTPTSGGRVPPTTASAATTTRSRSSTC